MIDTGKHGQRTPAAAPTGSPETIPTRGYRVTAVTLLVITAAAGMAVALIAGGGAAELSVNDPGTFARWIVPSLKLVLNLAAALMIGPLVLALWSLKEQSAPFEKAIAISAVGAAAFTLAALASFIATFVTTFRVGLDDPLFANWAKTEAGLAWIVTIAVGAIITMVLLVVRGYTTTLLTAVATFVALIPMATQGHSGSLAGHGIAVNAIFLHMAAAAAWIGGLVALALIPSVRAKTIDRYSTIAIVAFAVVATSGLARAMVAIPSLKDLDTSYAALTIAKAGLLIAIGCLGAWYRKKLIPGIRSTSSATSRKAFFNLLLAEFVLMGSASGVAVALSRTPPPQGETGYASTPAQYLTGQQLPPELDAHQWLVATKPDILWITVAGFGIFFYLAGVWRLHKRGDSWPWYRTLLWVLGMLTLVWVTSGPLNAYQEYLFSIHMLGHMMLSMAIPLLLVMGTPVTLASRAIRKRKDGTRGGREWILWAVHSPYSRVITHPIVAAAIFIGSLWLFYFSDMVRWAVKSHIGHEWMVIHFLISGYLFVLTLLDGDPLPKRLPHAARLLTLIGVMAMHAFFGVAIMMQESLIVAEWYGSMGRTWGATPIVDQQAGGGIAWSVGEIPTLILSIIVAVQWSRSDTKIQRRADRHADRTGDAELAAYNQQLAELAERDARAAERGAGPR